jgi:glucosamine kinase
MAFYLGIDAGGTKTIAAISDGRAITGRAAAGTIKIKKVGPEQARRTLENVLTTAFTQAQIKPQDIVASCIGVAGAGLSEVVEWTTRNMQQLVPGKVKVVGDSDIAHEAAFSGGAGVLVIAGTGSIAFGRNDRGTTARAGGWGPAISDEGSGYWIGRKAVANAMKAFDSGRNTMLMGKIMEGWRAGTRDAVVSIANSSPPPDFSALVPHIVECAEGGDGIAQEILTEAGMELAQLAKFVVRRLREGNVLPGIAVCGGVFKHAALVRQTFFNSLRAEWPQIAINPEPVDPIYGAIALAIKLGQQSERLASEGVR